MSLELISPDAIKIIKDIESSAEKALAHSFKISRSKAEVFKPTKYVANKHSADNNNSNHISPKNQSKKLRNNNHSTDSRNLNNKIEVKTPILLSKNSGNNTKSVDYPNSNYNRQRSKSYNNNQPKFVHQNRNRSSSNNRPRSASRTSAYSNQSRNVQHTQAPPNYNTKNRHVQYELNKHSTPVLNFQQRQRFRKNQ